MSPNRDHQNAGESRQHCLRQDREKVSIECQVDQSAWKDEPGKTDARRLANGRHDILFVPHISSCVARQKPGADARPASFQT
jgi:hypothetical protein